MNDYKIAIIDDDEDFSATLKEIIHSYGINYTIDLYHKSQDGIKAIIEKNYDILILDYFIDKLDGSDVVKAIREKNQDLYIIILTGFSKDIPALKAIKEFEIQDYCKKDLKNINSIIVRIESAVKSVGQLNRLKEKFKRESFSSKLKKLREAKEENQSDLAKILGVSRTAISGYESGRNEPSFDILRLIAQHYKVSTDYLLNNHY